MQGAAYRSIDVEQLERRHIPIPQRKLIGMGYYALWPSLDRAQIRTLCRIAQSTISELVETPNTPARHASVGALRIFLQKWSQGL
jgi:hypothetical protein